MFIAESPAMKETLDLANKVAHLDATVTVLGEPGAGRKTLIEHIHAISPRANAPLQRMDLSSSQATDPQHLPPGSSVVVDNVERGTPSNQAVLVQFLQGQNSGIASSRAGRARIFAVATPHWEEAVIRRRLREDLFYRLNVIPIRIPPLRDRRSDILPTARHLLSALAPHPIELSLGAIHKIFSYGWPGNVEELKAVLLSAARSSRGAPIKAKHIELPQPRDAA